MPKLDIENIEQSHATGYPAPFNAHVEGRWWRRLAPTAGLTQMGASHVVLRPGAWSSLRHWHHGEDELVIILAGEAVLVEDQSETTLRTGNIAAWAAGIENGHHLISRADRECVFIAISAGDHAAGGFYPDIGMSFNKDVFFQRDGSPFPAE